MNVQLYGGLHIDIDNYFAVVRNTAHRRGSSSAYFQLTIGILPFKKLQKEIAADLLESVEYPLYFNARIGMPEDNLFESSHAPQIGVLITGSKTDVTNQHIVYPATTKATPDIQRLPAGPYFGNKNVLLAKYADDETPSSMVSFDREFMPEEDSAGNEYNKIVSAGHHVSRSHAISGRLHGFCCCFPKSISFLSSPAQINGGAVNGK